VGCAVAGCANIAGTDDLYLCETCPEGGGGAGGSGAGGGGGCGPGESEVTLTLQNDAWIVVLSTQQTVTMSTSLCLPDGEQELQAVCADGESADVLWGNGACMDFEDQCKFTLSGDTSFVVDAMEDCSDG
jgi:hypothetical protein